MFTSYADQSGVVHRSNPDRVDTESGAAYVWASIPTLDFSTAVDLYLSCYSECGVTSGGAMPGPMNVTLVSSLVSSAMNDVLSYWLVDGTPPPFEHYVVHMEAINPLGSSYSYGFSVEHLESCSIGLLPELCLSESSQPPPTEEMIERFQYNIVHHMSHAFVPKRSFGVGYFPFSWEVNPVIDSIWFSEGFVQYAAVIAHATYSISDPNARTEYIDWMMAYRFNNSLQAMPIEFTEMNMILLSRIASYEYATDFRTGTGTHTRVLRN